MRDLPRGTVTFLFTDIEGSTRLLHELGDRYADALEEHRRALREAFGRHRGVEVDTQGDAFFYAFERASDAVDAAADGQAALDGGPIRVRMGLHTGEPTVTAEGYVGLDVHRGARIAAVAQGGQVVVSEAAARLVDVPMRDLGEHRLKDLTAPQRLFQLGGGEFPPLRTLYQTNLPIPATPFLGRDRELAEVAGLLGGSRLVTLTGAGGTGKTRLALQAAGAAADGFPHGVWWAPLAQVRDPADVMPAAARALGARGPLEQAIGESRLLLLVDNFEQVVEAAPGLGELLAACPNLVVLATSRERLRLAGEQVYPVPVLERSESCELFAARALAADPGFEPDEAVAELCERLDDLPLALELAAARTALLPARELLARIGGRLDLRGGRDADRRQETLRATIAWSYELLSPEEQCLLAALSTFRGGWTLEAAERVCDADVDLLESLADKSLIRRWESGRFGMLETIREFAAERAEELVDRDALVRRLLDFLLELADRACLREELPFEERHELVRPERGNVDAALEWALERGEVDLGLRLVWHLEHYWAISDPAGCLRWIDALLARGDPDPAVLARAHRLRGGAFDMSGRGQLALAEYESAVALFRTLGEEDRASHVEHRMAGDLARAGEIDRAEAMLGPLLEYDRTRDRGRDEAFALHLLAEIAHGRGDDRTAVRLARAAAERAGEVGWPWMRGLAHLNLAEWLTGDGDPLAGAKDLQTAVEVLVPMDDSVNVGFALATATWIGARLGDPRGAGRSWGALEAAAEREPTRGWRQALSECAGWAKDAAGEEFDRGRERGRRLSPEEALEVFAGQVEAAR